MQRQEQAREQRQAQLAPRKRRQLSPPAAESQRRQHQRGDRQPAGGDHQRGSAFLLGITDEDRRRRGGRDSKNGPQDRGNAGRCARKRTMGLLPPGFLHMRDHFPQQVLLADRAELQAVHAGGMRPQHEQLPLRGEIFDPFDQQAVGRLAKSDHIAVAGWPDAQGDFTDQHVIPVPEIRLQAAACDPAGF